MGVRREPRRDRCAGCAKVSPTGCGSITPTASSIRAATSSDSPTRPAAPTCSSRRSSSTASELPRGGQTDGTTGYDALGEIDRVLIDPAGERARSTAARRRLRGGRSADCADLIHDTKRMIADTIQRAEVLRLVARARRDPDDERRRGRTTPLAELLACFPVYRSYLPAGREHLDAGRRARRRARRPDLADAIDRLVPVLADPAHPTVARRFQQTTGLVMAKGVEDTAFYRYTRLGSPHRGRRRPVGVRARRRRLPRARRRGARPLARRR